eukprot:IDg19205t1
MHIPNSYYIMMSTAHTSAVTAVHIGEGGDIWCSVILGTGTRFSEAGCGHAVGADFIVGEVYDTVQLPQKDPSFDPWLSELWVTEHLQYDNKPASTNERESGDHYMFEHTMFVAGITDATTEPLHLAC